MQANLINAWSRYAKGLLALTILTVLVFSVDFKELWGALSQLTFLSLGYLLLISCLLIYISALKWGAFLRHFGSDVSVIRLFRLYLVGYFVNLILPSYLGGDVVRSWYVGKKIGQHEALTATILERYTGLAAMITLGIVFVWFVSAATWQIKLAVCAMGVGFVALTWVALSERLLQTVSRIAFLSGLVKHMRKIQEGFKLAGSDRSLLFKALLLSFLYHCITVVNTIAAGAAVGWFDPPVLDLFVVLPLILVIGALPVTPNGLGIQEGAFFFFLVAIGATPAQALGIGLVLRVKSYILALIGGVCWLAEGRTVRDAVRVAS